MKKTAVILGILITMSMSVVKVWGERRITLDGADGAKAPHAEPGQDAIDRIHKVDQPQLIVFPTAKKPSRGTIMVCPGGGYGILAVNHEGTEVAKMLNEAGWDAAVLLYRVSEGGQTRALALEDAKAGLALIRKRGGEFGLATKTVGVMGFSAGGHLSARVAHEAAAAGKAPGFLVLIYPAYLEKAGKLLDEVIPPGIPMFAYVAANDGYKASAIALDAYCREHQLKCDYHLAEGGGHGFGLKKPLPEAVKDWPQKLGAFLAGLSG